MPETTMPKTVHCIRHGQSTFNAHYAEFGVDPIHFDAPLTEIGQQQVAERAADIARYRYDLVVTTPLTRAIQTTLGLFKDHPAPPPVQIECLHREHLGSSCDVGRAPALLREAFPHLSFGHLDDIWWHNDGEPGEGGFVLEPVPVFQERVQRFRAWLASRPETLIAVVGHGTFFQELTGQTLRNCEVAVLEL